VNRGGVERPVPTPQAFGREDTAALQSQAAMLLLMRAQLRRDDAALSARAKGKGRRARVELAPARDVAALRVPRVTAVRRRVPEGAVLAALAARYGPQVTPQRARLVRPKRRPGWIPFPDPPVRPTRAVPPDVLADLARRVSRNPGALNLAQLTRACLQHRHELPRVAAAATHFELSSRPEPALGILARSLSSADPLVRLLAATAMARIAPEDERLRALLRPRRSPSSRRPSHTSLLVHGTFAQSNAWWQPGGDFHEYLRAEVRPDLYGASDRFDWSGGWSDAARALGASDLRAWVDTKGLAGLDLFTHSHGGSVAMLASQDGLAIGDLVLLSCPVHVHKYVPDFARVSHVVSVRVHLDLVILIDGGGQRFLDPRIEEHVLPIWFDHFASHDPQVWRDHNVPSLL
jgi:hypothetical protein